MAQDAPTVARVEKWGLRLLALGASVTALVLVLASVMLADYIYLAPIALLAIGAMAYLLTHLDHFLWVVILLFGFTADFDAGVQLSEVAFLILYVVFTAVWSIVRVGAQPGLLVATLQDRLVLWFIIYLSLAFGLGIVQGAKFATAANMAYVYSLLVLYFPLKEYALRSKHGLRFLLGVVVFFGVAALIRNLLVLRLALSDAAYAWEVATGRVAVNEMLLYASATLTWAWMLVESKRWNQRVLFALASLLSLGVVLTQFRSYYVALALALVIIAIAVDTRGRRSLLWSGSGALVLGSVVLYAMLGNLLILLVGGLIERLASLGSVGTDGSLVNRFYESAAIWDLIKNNPIAGYGLGVEFGFFSILDKGTWVKTFAHNTYLMLWYRFGLLGGLLFLSLIVITIAHGFRAYKQSDLPRSTRFIGLALAATQVGMLPTHLAAASYNTPDTIVLLAILLAMGAVLQEQRMSTVIRQGPAKVL
ncbi:MAG: O-antigen ligase family protein [Bacteroidota bacterium]